MGDAILGGVGGAGVVHGELLSMGRCCPWVDVVHGGMLSMGGCCPGVC